MKNKIVLLLLLVLGNPVFAQEQIPDHKPIDELRLRCTYVFKFQQDSSNSEDVRSEKMVLFIGKHCSRYWSYNRLKTDSLCRDFDRRGVPPQVAVADMSIFPMPRVRHQIFKNYPEGELTYIERLFGDKFVYTQPLNTFHWEVQADTAIISGYRCQKALTTFAGRDYVAWFTSEIPVSDGPYKFHGLPGLIIKIGDTRNHYLFELISVVKPAAEIHIYYPTYPTVCTTPEGLRRAKEDAKANAVARLEAMGGNFKSPEDREMAKIRIKKNQKRKNNPIELK